MAGRRSSGVGSRFQCGGLGVGGAGGGGGAVIAQRADAQVLHGRGVGDRRAMLLFSREERGRRVRHCSTGRKREELRSNSIS
jgi:hypothetical protein